MIQIEAMVKVLWHEDAIIYNANDLPRGIVVILVNKKGYPIIGKSGVLDDRFKYSEQWQAFLVCSEAKFGPLKLFRYNLKYMRKSKMKEGERPKKIDGFGKNAKFLPAFCVNYKNLKWEKISYIIFSRLSENNINFGYMRVKRPDMSNCFQSIGKGQRNSEERFREICKEILKKREGDDYQEPGRQDSGFDKQLFDDKLNLIRSDFLFIPVSFT